MLSRTDFNNIMQSLVDVTALSDEQSEQLAQLMTDFDESHQEKQAKSDDEYKKKYEDLKALYTKRFFEGPSEQEAHEPESGPIAEPPSNPNSAARPLDELITYKEVTK